MKILLDENLPKKLKIDLGEGFKVKTVREMDWQGKKNGELLGLLTINGFDVLLTIDTNLKFQQNLNKFDIKIIVLNAFDNKHQTLQMLVPDLINTLNKLPNEQIIEINLDK